MNAVPRTVRSWFEPGRYIVICRNKLRKWAAENSYTLILMSVLFLITWGWIVVTRHV
jgi:hypothetical protein